MPGFAKAFSALAALGSAAWVGFAGAQLRVKKLNAASAKAETKEVEEKTKQAAIQAEADDEADRAADWKEVAQEFKKELLELKTQYKKEIQEMKDDHKREMSEVQAAMKALQVRNTELESANMEMSRHIEKLEKEVKELRSKQ